MPWFETKPGHELNEAEGALARRIDLAKAVFIRLGCEFHKFHEISKTNSEAHICVLLLRPRLDLVTP